jgi:hypothetical protein
MRKSLATVAAALTLVAAASLLPHRAQATPLSAAAGIGSAVGETNVAAPVTYACGRVWRCGPFGCGFRSVCGWRPGPYGFHHRPFYHRPYWGRRAWAFRPHWRGHWRGGW